MCVSVWARHTGRRDPNSISPTHTTEPHPTHNTTNSYLLALLDHLPTQPLPKGLLLRLQLILDLALLDVTALHFFPSTLAAAALGLLLPPEWAPALTACTVRRVGFVRCPSV